MKKTKIINFIGAPGVGKCHGINTEILMFDGTVKLVQDIQIGELLMGDDSNPRTVCSLARGQAIIYEIQCENRERFTVNEHHILCLRYGKNKNIYYSKERQKYRVRWFDHLTMKTQSFKTFEEATTFLEDIEENKDVEMTVRDFLSLSKTLQKHLKCHFTGVDFEERNVQLDPYMLGLWLGDGTSSCAHITNQDAPVLKYFAHNLSKYNCYLDYREKYTYAIDTLDVIKSVRNKNKNNPGTKQNKFREKLSYYNLLKNKHIPQDYKCNTRDIRLKVLAGLIDSDGEYGTFNYTITQKFEILARDILYLCRSLGFSASIRKVKRYCEYKGEKRYGTYYSVYFSGERLSDIPVLCERKKASSHSYSKDMSLVSFKIKEIGFDDYYGFTVDSNHRYLLGNFIVSHNSTMAALCFVELKSRHLSAEYVQEYAKMLIYKKEFEKLNQQYHVSLEQYKMIKAVDGNVDYICVDSSLLLGLLYNKEFKSNVSDKKKTEEMILSKMEEFDNIYIFLERNDEFEFEKQGRVHDEQQSRELDKKFKQLLDKLKLPYLTVLSDRSKVGEIISYIMMLSNDM